MVVSRKGLGNTHDERHAVYVINYAEDVWINSGVLRDASQDGVLTAAVTTTYTTSLCFVGYALSVSNDAVCVTNHAGGDEVGG